MSKTSTGQDLEIDELFTIGEDTVNGETFPTIKIFGWAVWRVFRDSNKNILKIVLMRDGMLKEFDAGIIYPRDQSKEGLKKAGFKIES